MFLEILPKACNFIKKESLAQVFSCEFCEISKNIFFTEHLWATASVYFGFIECSYLHLFWQVFGRNSRVIENWDTNSSYARLSFVKKTHAMSLFLIFHVKLYFCLLVQFLMFWNSIGTLTNPIRQVKSTRKFFHALKVFPNSFCSCSLKNNLTRKLILKDSAVELTVGPRVLDSWVQTPPSTLFIP